MVISNRHNFPIIWFPEGSTHILHLLGNGIFPEGVYVIFIQGICLRNRLRRIYPKLVSLIEVERVPLLDEGILFLTSSSTPLLPTKWTLACDPFTDPWHIGLSLLGENPLNPWVTSMTLNHHSIGHINAIQQWIVTWNSNLCAIFFIRDCYGLSILSIVHYRLHN